jgi:hypothetical protein
MMGRIGLSYESTLVSFGYSSLSADKKGKKIIKG